MRIWEDEKDTYIPVTIQFTNESEFRRFHNIINNIRTILYFKPDRELCDTIMELINKL